MSKGYQVEFLRTKHADVFLSCEKREGLNYRYGGTRMIGSKTSDYEVYEELLRLMHDESGLKNDLINLALRNKVLHEYPDILSEVPNGFLESSVGGGRCIIRPQKSEYEEILTNPNHPDFEKIVMPIFQAIGNHLNKQQGYLKLTPDFGRFAGLADLLHQFTNHSLGIRCEVGGCGGKSSYSTTGIIAAFETMEKMNNSDFTQIPLTLIGSAGAMGSEFLQYVKSRSFGDVVICDLQYNNLEQKENNYTIYNAQRGKFIDECLQRGGVIVATTFGKELEQSCWTKIPEGTLLILAHNLAIPAGQKGIELMQEIKNRNIVAIPGQILTLGGALTSRLEWYWRLNCKDIPFNKPLAHKVVRAVISYLVRETLTVSKIHNIAPYEAMLRLISTESNKIAEASA